MSAGRLRIFTKADVPCSDASKAERWIAELHVEHIYLTGLFRALVEIASLSLSAIKNRS